jgi:hypothetical protein
LSTFLHCRKARAVSMKKAALRSVTATLSRSTVRATSRAVPASPRVTASPAQAGPTPPAAMSDPNVKLGLTET